MKRTRNMLLGLTVLVAASPVRLSHAAPPAPGGKLGPDLFLAIGRRDPAGIRALLARGADPNARNFLQFTPLMFAAASGQVDVARTLVAAGAKVDAASPYGTALTFAGLGASAPVMQFLLARGARPDPHRPDGITVLMLAARNGQSELIKTLLAKKADVNARDNDQGTALIHAARAGQTKAARVLLEKGAAINAADSQGWTALVHAGLNGHLNCVRLLLAKGADPNLRDKKGRTPVMVVASYSDRPEVVRALAEGGADLQAKDGKDRTALALAAARGRTESAQVLRDRSTDPSPAQSSETEKTARTAVAASLPLLEHSMRIFAQRTGCVSCHQEGLGRMATGMARERGFAIDATLSREQARRVAGMLAEFRPALDQAAKDPKAMKAVPSVEIREFTPTMGFILAGMAAHQQPRNATLGAAALILARQQESDGHWQFILQRVPIQSSAFTMTALAVRAMQTYAPKERAPEVARRVQRARTWLLTTPAETTEDKAFRLLGLQWAGASREKRQKAVEELRADQRPDGGWAQLGAMQSDAYATGEALVALSQAGELPVSDLVYQRGVRFLLQTQDDDGSWFVNKRAIPANNYFDAEFPHGQAQYASFGATCWATMALMLSANPPAPVRQAQR